MYKWQKHLYIIYTKDLNLLWGKFIQFITEYLQHRVYQNFLKNGTKTWVQLILSGIQSTQCLKWMIGKVDKWYRNSLMIICTICLNNVQCLSTFLWNFKKNLYLKFFLSFNENSNSNDDLILHVNIRSLNSNVDKSQIYVDRLKNKLKIIVIWNVEIKLLSVFQFAWL